MTLDVFVPVPDSVVAMTVLRGSAIVGTEKGNASWLIDYEGNRYGVGYYEEYTTRLLHAAGRHVARYPTTARMLADERELVRVGSYDYEAERLDLDDPDALFAWIGAE